MLNNIKNNENEANIDNDMYERLKKIKQDTSLFINDFEIKGFKIYIEDSYLNGFKDVKIYLEIQEKIYRQNYKQVIEEVIKILKSNKKLDEYSRFEMCNNLYSLLLQYFESPNRDDENRKEIELNACRYAIQTLIPIVEDRVYSNEEYMPKYYELWQKAYAFAGRRSLEHFIDYIEMDMPVQSRVLANRRNVLRPFVFYLNKSAFDPKLQYIEASFPPRIWEKLHS